MASTSSHILLVDGHGGFTAMAAAAAELMRCPLTTLAGFEAALQLMATRDFALILVDANAADGNALGRFLESAADNPAELVLLGGHASLHSRHDVTAGRIRHMPEPISVATLKKAVVGAIPALRPQESSVAGDFHGIVGGTPQMRALFTTIRRLAALDLGVLVQGESGTGKELVARALHDLSGRTGKFVAVNCGAIAPELLSSQLFGHERGSFTGATQSHAGYFEQAAGGTLLLDEVTEMPLPLQVYLLRVIESQCFTRVGGSREIPVAARIVAASNRDLGQAVATGRFRQDLYFRLRVFPLVVPPLRERNADIPLLVRHFVRILNQQYHTSKHASDRLIQEFAQRAWPGNVRELRHELQRLCILSEETDEIDAPSAAEGPLRRRATDAQDVDHHATNGHGHAAPPLPGAASVQFEFGMTLDDVERKVLLNTLAKCGNSKPEAARILGVSLKTIYNKLLRYRTHDRIGPDVLDEHSEKHRHPA